VVYKRIFRIRQIVCCVATLAILPVCAAAATSFSALRVLVQFQADYSARETINPWWYVFVDGLLILYYVGVYQWLRRERSPVPVVPQYTPPDRMSPAAMRYLLAGDSDRQTVAAVLLNLAARGSLYPTLGQSLPHHQTASSVFPSICPSKKRPHSL